MAQADQRLIGLDWAGVRTGSFLVYQAKGKGMGRKNSSVRTTKDNRIKFERVGVRVIVLDAHHNVVRIGTRKGSK